MLFQTNMGIDNYVFMKWIVSINLQWYWTFWGTYLYFWMLKLTNSKKLAYHKANTYEKYYNACWISLTLYRV